MYTIVSNASGTRTMQISDEHLDTIQRYSLFRNLVDSNGIVDDTVLDKLRLNTRSLVESTNASDRALLDLSLEVLNHPNMKPVALHNLILLYTEKKG
ncbi:MAG: hypothetical protein IJ782_05965 [Prevotella sp.]|nr:hypothetical protein [Prevotella sp.]